MVVEEFDGLSLTSIVTTPIASNLVKLQSFEDEPNLSLSAYDLLHYDADQATPAMTLTSSLNGTINWTPNPTCWATLPTTRISFSRSSTTARRACASAMA